MNYQNGIVFCGARDAKLEGILEVMCDVSLFDDVEEFLGAVSTCNQEAVVVVLGEAGPVLDVIVAAARAAARWQPESAKCHWTVAAHGGSAEELVRAFRSGCDGYIRLPATRRQILRGLPTSFRGRCSTAEAEVG